MRIILRIKKWEGKIPLALQVSLLTLFFFSFCRPPFLKAETEKVAVAVESNFASHRTVRGYGGMIAAAHPLAAKAGIDLLSEGGNAADALVVVQTVLNVVEPQSSGIGGGAFLLYYRRKDGRIFAIDAREKAPAAADENLFLKKDGEPIRFQSRITGGLAVGVPGTPALLDYVIKNLGTKKISSHRLFAPAIQLAENGFRISPLLARELKENSRRLKRFPAGRKIFFGGDGKPPRIGDLLVQKELAGALTLLERRGPLSFYRPPIAAAIVRTVTRSPVRQGKMTLRDLEQYRVVERRPVQTLFRGYRVITMPPPSSGIIMLQVLKLLEPFGSGELARDTLLGIHLKLEAEKLAFADREFFVADPDFGHREISGLLDSAYLNLRRKLIRRDRALPGPFVPGSPPGISSLRSDRIRPGKAGHEGINTTHFTIVDGEGNIAVCTSTIEQNFGSALVVDGYGFLLNNELTDFAPEPGSINSPAGNKRPRSSMSPTLVFEGDRPILGLGSPGGTFIPGAILEVLLRTLNEGSDIQSAINAPRIMVRHRRLADVEPPFYGDRHLIRALKKMRHRIPAAGDTAVHFGAVQAIRLDRDGLLLGGADPRREGIVMSVRSEKK